MSFEAMTKKLINEIKDYDDSIHGRTKFEDDTDKVC